MVTSIGISNSSASATQAAYAPTRKTGTEPVAITATTAAATEVEQTSPAPTVSAESAASAKLGDQLNAQADASRVQRAVDESSVSAEDSEETTVTDPDTEAAAAAAQAPASGAAPAGGAIGAGGASTSSETTDTDYIAEADTNSDKTVSDEERAVYEAKLRQQAEEAGSSKQATTDKNDALAAKTAEVRAAYGQDDSAAPALDITA